jgi:5-amino-6-(5-phosphoribosylamino)uracil reductase
MSKARRAPRPRVIANVAVSVDGKIDAAAREGGGFSSRFDRDRMDELRARADALVVGARTVRAEDPPLRVRDPSRRHQRASAGRHEDLTVVVVSRSGDLPPGARFLREPARRRMLAVPAEGGSAETLNGLERLLHDGMLEIFRAGVDGVDLEALLGDLAADDHQTILVEGGGEVIASFLEADLLDELFVTVCPCLIGGGGAPTLVDGEGWPLSQRRRLELAEMERVGDELFLHYELVGRARR